MSILNRARADARRILSGPDWSTVMTFTAPPPEGEEEGELAIITGTFFRVHLNVDPLDGQSLDSTHVHCTFPEIDLIAQYYPTRNAKGEVHFAEHFVKAADSTGIEKTYKIIKWHPDEVLGIIRCTLQEQNVTN